MSDITKCANKDCPLSGDCWRFLAPISAVQSYGEFNPDADGKCDMYWDQEEITGRPSGLKIIEKRFQEDGSTWLHLTLSKKLPKLNEGKYYFLIRIVNKHLRHPDDEVQVALIKGRDDEDPIRADGCSLLEFDPGWTEQGIKVRMW